MGDCVHRGIFPDHLELSVVNSLEVGGARLPLVASNLFAIIGNYIERNVVPRQSALEYLQRLLTRPEKERRFMLCPDTVRLRSPI